MIKTIFWQRNALFAHRYQVEILIKRNSYEIHIFAKRFFGTFRSSRDAVWVLSWKHTGADMLILLLVSLIFCFLFRTDSTEYYSIFIFHTLYDETRTQPKRENFLFIKKTKTKEIKQFHVVAISKTLPTKYRNERNERKTTKKKPWKQSNVFSFRIWKGYSVSTSAHGELREGWRNWNSTQ